MATQPAASGGQDGAPGGSSLITDPPPAYQEKNPQGPSGTMPPTAPPSMIQPPYGPYVQQGSPQYSLQPQQQIQYVLSIPAAPKPDFPGPHNFLAYVLFVTVICGFLNILSLAFSIPALICITMSMNQKSIGQYPSASKLATAAFVLANLTVVFTLLLWIVFVGLIVANTGSTTCRGILYDPYSGYRCST